MHGGAGAADAGPDAHVDDAGIRNYRSQINKYVWAQEEPADHGD